MNEQSMREAFVEWARSEGYDTTEDELTFPDGDSMRVYEDVGTAAAWAAYQAGAASSAKDAERYEWLKQGNLTDAALRHIEATLLPAGEHFDSLDEAIDAALDARATGEKE